MEYASKEYQEAKKLNQAKRNNAKLYPIYKMFAWDLLFFYAIEFLFYVQAKGLNSSEIMIVNSTYPLFCVLLQLPAVILTDKLGKRNSMIVGNILLSFHLIVLMILPGIWSVIISNFIFSLGYGMKGLSESNLLYDSVATKGGDSLYTKIDGTGTRWYYFLDGFASLLTGTLFVFNHYLPMFVCLFFTIISAILSTRFKEIYQMEEESNKTYKDRVVEYKGDLKLALKYIFQSKRLKSLIIFGCAFNSFYLIMYTFRESLLNDMQIPAQYFSLILAVLIIVSGLSAPLHKIIHKKLKNKALTFISLIFLSSAITIGIVASQMTINWFSILMIVLLYAIQYILISPFYILESKYLKSFTLPEMRVKISFTYDFVVKLTSTITGFIASILLDVTTTANCFLLVGLFYLAIIVVILDYMRKRFGLKPDEYDKRDVEITIAK